ncbi:hypothetical protein EVAR_74847_1 [Eumeta japonica]|uniref:Uncharacterized protein n=1 Tax=Eumeta variegata TaxID=151549 RepID=A0A4C1SPF4_EUMVA|nr:hypothetical protein EVAR_74847_1 [Eumeta japonica]
MQFRHLIILLKKHYTSWKWGAMKLFAYVILERQTGSPAVASSTSADVGRARRAYERSTTARYLQKVGCIRLFAYWGVIMGTRLYRTTASHQRYSHTTGEV